MPRNPSAKVAAAESPVKAPKEKKTKTTKTAKPKAPKNYPSYEEMIANAVVALGQRGGSSRQAIAKYILANYDIPEDRLKIHLKLAFRRLVEAEKLVQVKGSFKVSEPLKKETKKAIAAKNKAEGKTTVKKTTKAKETKPKSSPKKTTTKAKETKPKAKKTEAKPKSSPSKSPAKGSPKKTTKGVTKPKTSPAKGSPKKAGRPKGSGTKKTTTKAKKA